MLAILLNHFPLHKLIDQLLKQIICVSYFPKWLLGTFGSLPVIKRDSVLNLLT